MHTCPVCGYDRLEREPADFLVCPSCGIEFGYDDANTSHADLRRQWLERGAPWFSHAILPPAGWDAHDQLWRAFGFPRRVVFEALHSSIGSVAVKLGQFGSKKARSTIENASSLIQGDHRWMDVNPLVTDQDEVVHA